MTMTDPQREELLDVQMRQLALVDRIIGLEAEVAHLKAGKGGAEFRSEIKAIKSSATWRAGRIIIGPLAAVSRVLGAKSKK